MSSRAWDNPPVCQACGSASVARVLGGLPNFKDEELMQAVRAGRVILGGCCCPRDYWQCNGCGRTLLESGQDFDSWSAEERKRSERQWEEEQAILATPRGAFDHVKSLVAAAEDDVRKAERGNKAAGARVRRMMREIKTGAQKVRIAILVARSGNGGREQTSGLKESQR